jgi:multiple sugar transport system ATP-binding protein
MARVIFENVTKRYGGNAAPAVNNLNMEVHDREFLVLVGPSGCGKSTAMRMVAGLEEISDGRIIIGDRRQDHARRLRRLVRAHGLIVRQGIRRK